MGVPLKRNLRVFQGKTFVHVVRWGQTDSSYKAITAIPATAPAQLTVPGHGLPTGWPVAIVSVLGMIEINALATPPSPDDYHKVIAVDANTLQIPDINAAGFTPYVSGGYVQFQAPAPLTGYTARMEIKDRVGGTILVSLTSPSSGIAIDTNLSTVTVTIDAVTTAAITKLNGVYDLELVSPAGVVTPLLYGSVTVQQEVTT